MADISPELLTQIKQRTWLHFRKDHADVVALERKINFSPSYTWDQVPGDLPGTIKVVGRRIPYVPTQAEVHKYAYRLGEALSNGLKDVLSADNLPNGILYKNIADKVIPDTLSFAHGNVQDLAVAAQKIIDESLGSQLNALTADFAADRAYGLVDKLGGLPAEEAWKWLGEPVVNFVEKSYDDFIHKNAEARYNAGFEPKIVRSLSSFAVRTTRGKYKSMYEIPCAWCQGLAGTYNYRDVSNTGNDVFRRHEACRCDITFIDGGRVENVVTHKPIEDPAVLEERASYGLEIYRNGN